MSFHLSHVTKNQRHQEFPPGMPKTIPEPIARSVQIMHQSCVEINTISKWTNMSFHLTHIT
jgi:hypothetical protein